MSSPADRPVFYTSSMQELPPYLSLGKAFVIANNDNSNHDEDEYDLGEQQAAAGHPPIQDDDVMMLVYDPSATGTSVVLDPQTLDIRLQLSIPFGNRTQQDVNFLPDSNVLVAIGSSTGGIPTIGIYDHKWSSLPRPRWTVSGGAASLVTADGLYLFGGYHSETGSPLNVVQFLPHGASRWRTLLSRLRQLWVDGVAVLVNEQTHPCLVGPTSTFMFRSDGHALGPGPDLIIPRRGHSVVVLQDKVILVLGGTSLESSEPSSVATALVREVEVWHTETNKCVVVGYWDDPRSDFTALAINDRIYVAGGGSASLEVLEYDPIILDKAWLMTYGRLVAEEHRLRRQDQLPGQLASAPVEGDGEATLDANSISNNNSLMAGTAAGALLPLRLVDTAPTRPTLGPALTVRDRAKALQQYMDSLENLQEQYTVDACAERLNNYYDHAQRQLEHAREHDMQIAKRDVVLWHKETERLLAEARKTLSGLERFLASEKAFAAVLQTLDQDDYEDDIPSQIRCPITLNMMTDPVVAADGNTYERSALEEWFAKHESDQPISPLSGAVLSSKKYVPVHALKALCEQYAERIRKKKKNQEEQ